MTRSIDRDSVASTILRFVAYFFIALGFVASLAAGAALAIDFEQFRYATI